MEQQLTMVVDTMLKDTPVKYISGATQSTSIRQGEIYIEKFRLTTCPNQTQILNALQKRINRSDALRSQKHTLGLCILLLISKGYCVTSSTVEGIEDSFIERCWECVQVVSQNVPVELSEWIKLTMGTRTPSGYSILFCQPRAIPSSTELLRDHVSGIGKFLNIEAKDFGVPDTMWHRDDVLNRTRILHIRLRDRDLS